MAGDRKLRSNFVERHQHKCALGQPKVRNVEMRFMQDQVAHEEDIQIQRARSVGETARPVAAEFLLDHQ